MDDKDDVYAILQMEQEDLLSRTDAGEKKKSIKRKRKSSSEKLHNHPTSIGQHVRKITGKGTGHTGTVEEIRPEDGKIRVTSNLYTWGWQGASNFVVIDDWNQETTDDSKNDDSKNDDSKNGDSKNDDSKNDDSKQQMDDEDSKKRPKKAHSKNRAVEDYDLDRSFSDEALRQFVNAAPMKLQAVLDHFSVSTMSRENKLDFYTILQNITHIDSEVDSDLIIPGINPRKDVIISPRARTLLEQKGLDEKMMKLEANWLGLPYIRQSDIEAWCARRV